MPRCCLYHKELELPESVHLARRFGTCIGKPRRSFIKEIGRAGWQKGGATLDHWDESSELGKSRWVVIIGCGGIKPVNRGRRGRESGGRGEALCQRSPVAPYSVLSCRVGSSGG